MKINYENYKKNAKEKLTLLKDQNTQLKKKTREQEEMVKTIDELQNIIQSQSTNKNVLPSNNLNQYNEIRNLKNEKIRLTGLLEGFEDEKNDLQDKIKELEDEINRINQELMDKTKKESQLNFLINQLKGEKRK